MKCGEKHLTNECQKIKSTPVKCANCKGGHIAATRKCSRNPANQNRDSETNPKVSYAAAAAGTSAQTKTNGEARSAKSNQQPTEDERTHMKNMFSQMSRMMTML